MYRRFEDVDAVELARYAKARRITDNRKLAAMLPAHIKRDLFKPKKPIEYAFSQRFPLRLFTVLTPDSHRPQVFKDFKRIAEKNKYDLNNPAHYIKVWEQANKYCGQR